MTKEAPEPKKRRFGFIGALIAKGAKLLKAFKVFKALKLMKIAGTFLSMGLSVFVYSFLMGPWFSIGFVLLLFVHEMGHILALKARGYKAGAPLFIPLIGAVIFAPEFKDRDDEAFIGFGGPLLGGLASALMLLWWHLGQSELVLRLAYTSAFLNLFNLLPIRPLDGGRVMQVAGTWAKYVGLVMLSLLTWTVQEPSLALVWILILEDVPLEPKFRARFSLALTLFMSSLMLMGRGNQPRWVNGIDMVIASLITHVYFHRTRREGEEAPGEILPQLPFGLRLGWVTAFTALCIGLVALMAGSTPETHRPAIAMALGLAMFVTAAKAAVFSCQSINFLI